MPYLALAIANRFLEMAKSDGKPMTLMKLQKLVYFAHGWHLGYERGPLSAENAEAWRWGPVFPELYHSAKRWGGGQVRALLTRTDFEGGSLRSSTPRLPAPDTFEQRLIARVWEVYGDMSGPALSRLTHEPGGPWHETWQRSPGRRHMVIPNDLIRGHFRKKLRANGGK